MQTPSWAKTIIDHARTMGIPVLNLDANYAPGLTPLSEIPTEIFYMPKLKALILCNNKISYVPSEIANLRLLEILNLENNLITAIPDSISEVKNLKSLNLNHNRITEIPESILELKELSELTLYENPLITPPYEVAVRGIEAIQKYFRQLSLGQDFLYEAKLIILGEGGAGKTSLANKILNRDYVLRDEISTQGIDVLQWLFQTESRRKYRVNMWDFGGQEIYHTTHQFFLTKRSLYILVADTRKEDTDFYYWLNIIELLSDNSPLLIVKNEKQDRHREINEKILRGEFDNLKDVLAVNLATNRGLDELRNEIKHYMKKLPHIGSPLPRAWVRVREILEKDSRNHIPISEYLEVCKANGFTDTKDSLQLSGYLHDIGVFLHFQDDPLLNKTVILKPRWGTDAVYKVLDNKDVIRNKGQFNRFSLSQIWNLPEYVFMQDELLQLMMRFKLCYKIPNTINEYIAPQLLTENQPDYEWDDNENLLLRYIYEFMPKGILTQFIVAMHPSIENQSMVWKSGVILMRNETRAEVIEHYGRREIFIRVFGAHKKELMSIVMYELDKIHKAYKRLKYDKLIPCICTDCKSVKDPYFYRYEILQKFISDKQKQIQCPKSYKMVDVPTLLDESIGYQTNLGSEKNLTSVPQIQITVGDYATVGDIVLDSITQSYFNQISLSDIPIELKETLQRLIKAVTIMNQNLPMAISSRVSEDLKILVNEATLRIPNPKWYKISIDGLIRAAENLGKIGKPVVELATVVLNLLQR